MSEIVINVTKTDKEVTINATPNVTQILVNTNSGGGGAVDSVNGQTGVVVLDANDVGAEPAKGANDNYVTDAQLVVINNTSGTNTGDQNLSGLVPYTGATSDVDLGTHILNAKALSVKGTAGAGHINLKHQSSNATAGGQETALFAGSDGELYYKNDGLTLQQVASRVYADTKVADSITNGVTTIAPSQNAVFDALALKVGQAVFTDRSLTSTIVGWSSFTFRFIYEYDFGNGFVLVEYFIQGTSNLATTSFTLSSNNVSIQRKENNVQVTNNGVISNTNGLYAINGSSNVVNFFQNSNETAFTASNQKSVRGAFIYYKG